MPEPAKRAKKRRPPVWRRRSRPRQNSPRRKRPPGRSRLACRNRAQCSRQDDQAGRRREAARKARRPGGGDCRGLALSVGPDPRRPGPLSRAARGRSRERISPQLIADVTRVGLAATRRRRGDARAAPRQGRGRAADRARRHRRRLAGRACHARAHRFRRCGARRGGALPAARRGRAGKAQARAIRPDPEQGCGYVVLAMGKMGAHELNYSSDIDLIVLYDETRRARRGHRAGRAVRPPHAQPRQADAGAHRRRLRVPHRPAAAPRSGLDADRDLAAVGAELLREHRAELGARRDDQGAPLRRRPRGRRGVPEARSRRSSGANISTTARSPTCTR